MASSFVRPYVRPRSPEDYPTGPCFTAGHLVETNASWRSERPVLSVERCTGCLRCYLACPDGAVLRAGAAVIGVKGPQVDHPLPQGEGRGEGTALHVESRRGRGHSTLVTSASGSVEASPSPPSPSPGGRGEIRFEDLRLTPNGAAVRIDYDFCKGCGICARECGAQAILMIPEENKHVR